MISHEQIKRFLLHPEEVVQKHAIRYFAESYIHDHDLVPLLLQGLRDVIPISTLSLSYAKELPHTPETLQYLFESLEMNTPFGMRKYYLEEMIANADLHLLERYSAKFRYLLNPIQKKIAQRYELAKIQTDTLLEEFQWYCKRRENDEENSFGNDYGELLVKELAKRPDLNPAEVLERLHRAKENDSWYELIYLTMLAGQLKLNEAIPLFVDQLGSESDYLAEATVDALVRIGTKQVIAEIERRFPDSEWDFCLFAGNVLARSKLPESEQALMRLLPIEQDRSIATVLADGLCKQLSTDGIPLVIQQIERGYDSMMLSLEESLYVNCLINEIHLPELDVWKQQIDNEQKRILTYRKELNSTFESKKHSSLNRYGLPKTTPHVNQVKVGRNDPCICGSGKKYKKCCGN